MFTLLFWATLAVAVADWVATWQDWGRVRWLTKPAALILLTAWFTQMTGWRDGLMWFGLALVFSTGGDILLMLPEKQYFIFGLGSFFLAHVAYVVGFLQSPMNLDWKFLLPLLLVGLVFWVLRSRICAGVRRRGELSMLIPVTAYAAILSLMLLAALTTLFRPAWFGAPALLASLGAGLFLLSDSFLAFDRFVRPLPAAALKVMVTYHLGQILITTGVVLFSLGGSGI